MGSIVSPWTGSCKRRIHETCSLVILFRIRSVGELLGAVAVRTRGTNRLAGGASTEGAVDAEKAGVAQSSRGWTPTDPGEVEHRQIVGIWASISW